MKREYYLFLVWIGIVIGSIVFNKEIGIEIQVGYTLGLLLVLLIPGGKRK